MSPVKYLRNPIYVVRRVIYKFYELTHSDEPWIAQGAVRYLDRHLNKHVRALEWGSGRSTLWFATRVGSILSVEYNSEWHKIVTKKLSGVSNTECRFIPLDHPTSEPTWPHYDSVPAYVAVVGEFPDESLDLIIIDGHYRQACVLAALPKLESGGLLVIDNTNRLPLSEWGVPPEWTVVHQSRNVMTETTIWRKP